MTAQIKKLRKEVLLYERIKKRSFKIKKRNVTNNE